MNEINIQSIIKVGQSKENPKSKIKGKNFSMKQLLNIKEKQRISININNILIICFSNFSTAM